MKLFGIGEFRGKELKQSAKGNPYYSLIFEDTENGQQLRCYSPSGTNYSFGTVDSLVKGQNYDLAFNYHYDYGKWSLDLIDIRSKKEGGK